MQVHRLEDYRIHNRQGRILRQSHGAQERNNGVLGVL